MEQQVLDIETGMAVYGGNGQIIGTVTKTAGFGSTSIDPATDSADARLTRARSGTGYLKVERPDREDLYVPFHGIEEVIPERGVYLTTSMVDELRRGVDAPPQQAVIPAQPQRRGWTLGQRRRWNLGQPRRWRLWRPHTWPVWGRSEAMAAPAELEKS